MGGNMFGDIAAQTNRQVHNITGDLDYNSIKQEVAVKQAEYAEAADEIERSIDESQEEVSDWEKAQTIISTSLTGLAEVAKAWANVASSSSSSSGTPEAPEAASCAEATSLNDAVAAFNNNPDLNRATLSEALVAAQGKKDTLENANNTLSDNNDKLKTEGEKVPDLASSCKNAIEAKDKAKAAYEEAQSAVANCNEAKVIIQDGKVVLENDKDTLTFTIDENKQVIIDKRNESQQVQVNMDDWCCLYNAALSSSKTFEDDLANAERLLNDARTKENPDSEEISRLENDYNQKKEAKENNEKLIKECEEQIQVGEKTLAQLKAEEEAAEKTAEAAVGKFNECVNEINRLEQESQEVAGQKAASEATGREAGDATITIDSKLSDVEASAKDAKARVEAQIDANNKQIDANKKSIKELEKAIGKAEKAQAKHPAEEPEEESESTPQSTPKSGNESQQVSQDDGPHYDKHGEVGNDNKDDEDSYYRTKTGTV